MSSANKNNILKEGEKPIEKEDLYGTTTLEDLLMPTPMFDMAGKGYAWIMLDFNSLSDENKDLLFSLEEKKTKNGINIGGRRIWFVHPYEMTNIEYKLRIGEYDIEFLRNCGVPEDQIPNNVQIDEKLIEFEKRHIVLGYGGIYPTQSVFLRMPVNEQTTVDEVELFFSTLANNFKNQTRNPPHISQYTPESR